MPFAGTWIDLESVLLSAINQMIKGQYFVTSLLCGILKIQQTSQYNQKHRPTDLENKLVVTSGEKGEGQYRAEREEAQIIGCKMSSRMYCTTWGIESIFCNNCKCKITFKNCIKIFLYFRKRTS